MDEPKLTDGGYSIFHETMADMTYLEVEELARSGAIVLWALGVIEEHGPHLPLGTDVYLPYATLKRARRLLEARGRKTIILPPFYWGINNVTGSFAGSITVRPETMINLMLDVFQSLRKDGFETVFCLSGQGDALHNQTMVEGITKGRVQTGIRAYMVISTEWFERLAFRAGDSCFITFPFNLPERKYVDVHAGCAETSIIWGLYPELVRKKIIPTLKPTNFGNDDLREWRKGWSNARRKTPLGYLGDPASADPVRGRSIIEEYAGLVADAILKKLEGGSP